jgi:hypothetical protein
MIDNFALGLTHGLMLYVAWRLLSRRDLDDDAVPPPARPAATRGWAAAAPEAEERA